LWTAFAAVLATVVLVVRDPKLDPRFVEGVFWLSLVALLTQMLNYMLARNATGSISFIPFLASAAVAPDWVAVAGVGCVAAVVQLTRRRGLLKSIFNICQQCLSVAAAILVYRAVGGRSLLEYKVMAEGVHYPYFALATLFTTFFIVNSVCVSGVVATSDGKRFHEVWSANTLGTLPYDLLSWPLILGLAYVYVRSGAPGTFALAVPLLGIRQLYKVNWQLEKTNQELLELMVAAIEARDPYTSGHSRRVSESARIIAQIVGLRQSEVKRVEIAALLHDVGKIHEVFAPILQKPGRLTAEEHAIMQTHPIKSEELVSRVSQLRDIVAPVRHHHENWDGTGYPDGLAGELIPQASRIIMFADTIDAMTSDRPYRKALDETAVRQELVKYRAKQFDPAICDALLSSPRFGELFVHGSHQSLPHTQEVPKLRLATQ
jgi:hypothetical protein